MGTDTAYRDELAEQAYRMLDSDNPSHQEQGAELAHLVSLMTPQREEQQQNSQGQSSGVLASAVEELPLEWVWKNWIPKQFVGMFVGDSGIGKSSLIRDLIRRLTRGEKLPDGQESDPCGVVIISYEEPTETVLVPRMRESGVDLSRVAILSTVKVQGKLGEPSERAFRVPDDLGSLHEAILSVDAGVVFIDPLMSMTDKAIARNQTAREVLDALQAVAQARGCAIVIVAHVNKGRSTDMRQRMNSSKAFYDMPRFIIAAAQDVSNPAQATLWMDKHSLCGAVPTLTYERKGGVIHYLSGHVEEAKAEYALAESQKTSAKIMQYIATKPLPPEGGFQARTVAGGIGETYDATRKQLARLTNVGMLERTERGYYKMPEKKEEKVETCPNSVPMHQIAPVPLTHDEYIAATNAPTVKLDVAKLSPEMQQVVAHVTNGVKS